MMMILRLLLVAGGGAFVLIGIGFLLDPANSAAGFGLEAVDASGMAALRADMTAFFVLGGGCMIWGGWRRNGDALLVPAALFSIALLGRCVSVLADGTVAGFWLPMMIEAVVAVLCLVASRVLPHRDLAGSAP